MPKSNTAATPRWSPPRPQNDWGAAILTSPWLWGVAMTVGFYQVLPLFPEDWAEFNNRYFCDHWIVYAEMASFFVGLAILLRKAFGLIPENRALNTMPLDQLRFEPHVSTDERAAEIAQVASAASPGLLRTHWIKRILSVCEYVLNRGSAEGLEGYLRYRADLAVEGLTGSLAFIRTITWAIPILGFLGTVLGITMALASLKFDPSELASSFEQALVGLGVAFDTTALALTLSLVLVFGTYLVERAEGAILGRVEELGIGRIAPLLPAGESLLTPLVEAETQAAEHLLKRTESLVNWQTGMWQQALEGLRSRWIESAEQQQVRFAESLQTGMLETLSGHAHDLASVRGEFLNGFRSVAAELAQVVASLQESTAASQAQFGDQVAATWQKLEGHLASVQAEQKSFLGDASRLLGDSMSAWHADLASATEAVRSQLAEMQTQSALLKSLNEQTGELDRLQTVLTHNLQTMRAIEAFEETIQSLNAAVHLLTIRSKGLSAAA